MIAVTGNGQRRANAGASCCQIEVKLYGGNLPIGNSIVPAIYGGRRDRCILGVKHGATLWRVAYSINFYGVCYSAAFSARARRSRMVMRADLTF